MKMKLEKNDKLVMIGDSITDCERKRPYGEGIFGGTGKGYVATVESMLTAFYPEEAIRVVNMGIGGNTVLDLKERWQHDVFDLKPDWLSIMIGINDVWRQFDQPLIKESHVYIKEYEETLRELVQRTRPLVKGLVLMTPFYIEPNKQDAMRNKMDTYGAIVKQIAFDFDCLYVDTQEAFKPVLKEIYPATLAWDRVHPSMAGHMILANAFLNVIDFDWHRMKN
jgi:lysophospholipase L1-like esterase